MNPQGTGVDLILSSVRWVCLLAYFGKEFNSGTLGSCGGKLRLIAVIEESTVFEKMLKRIGLDPQPPPIAPARWRVELFEAVRRLENRLVFLQCKGSGLAIARG